MRYTEQFHWQLIRDEMAEPAPTFRTPDETARYLLSQTFVSEPQEHFAVAYLNTRNRLIALEIVSKGTLNGSVVHPREVFRSACVANAAGVIIAHNHPSGDPTPSSEDLLMTQRIKDAGKILGIELLDSIIVSPSGTYVSFKEKDIL
jgi:DNA repair protein RadC